MIHAIFAGVIVWYIYDLREQNCVCALKEPYQKVYWASWAYFIARVGALLATIVRQKPLMRRDDGRLNGEWLFGSLLVSLAFFGYILYYLNMLRKEECICDDPYVLKSIVTVYSTLMVIFMAVVVLTLVAVAAWYRAIESDSEWFGRL